MIRPIPQAAAALPILLLISLPYAAGCGSTARTPADQAAADTLGTAAADTVETTRERPPERLQRTVPDRRRTPTAGFDTVTAGRFDQGKMWTFEDPPVDYFEETYGFRPDDEWFRRARLGALRIPNCSASFVSPNGLVLTNHHCARSHATAVGREGESILERGFYASSLDEERRVEGLWADQLIRIEDVTDEVRASTTGTQTDAEREEARREAIAAIEERLATQEGGEQAGIMVQVIALYSGGRYSAYVYRRYDDVRLVMIPELDVGFYGGDPDNFTYPRHTLDMTLFRVYDRGRPLGTEDVYFPWTDTGVEEGDAVFVLGNPGSTERLATVSLFEYRRDVEEEALLRIVESRRDAMQAYFDEQAAAGDTLDVLRNQIFSLVNAAKFYRGTVGALNEPVILARRRAAERNFAEAIREDPALAEEYGNLFEEMERIQEEKRAYAAETRAFLGLTPTSILGSPVLRRAIIVNDYLDRRGEGESDELLEQTLEQLRAVGDQPAQLQERQLTLRFQEFGQYLGEDSEIVTQILRGRTPEQAAREIVAGSRLVTAEETEAALRENRLTRNDPALEVAAALAPRLREVRSAMAGLGSREADRASRLGRARFEVYGTTVPPDATFSLRIADGVVRGYPYNGTIAPPYTNFYGLYDLYHAHGRGTPWNLPSRWLNPPATFDLETPLNFVSTNDIIGGNSGSPALNRDLELVGLIFDGNIESLSGPFIYMTERARAISVDARGMLEALREIYEADRVVLELETGRLVQSDEAAMSGGSR